MKKREHSRHRSRRGKSEDDPRHASRAVWQCVPQNTLYPAIPGTVEKALDHPRLGTSGKFGILLHRDLAL